MSLRSEILEQPAALRRQLEAAAGELDPIGDAVRARDVGAIVIAARGSSDHAAIYGQDGFGVRKRIPVAVAGAAVN